MALDMTGQFRYPPPRRAWLARHVEPILEPDLPIIDAHHHLWEEPGNPYLIDDLLADLTTGHRIMATVFVQAHYGYRDSGPEHLRPAGETERVEAHRTTASRRLPSVRTCAAIVGYGDLLAGDRLEELLDAHMAAAPQHFRGVRQSVARDSHFPDGIVLRPAPPGMFADARFRDGLRRVGRRELTFDAMLYHEQIPELADLVREVTGTLIIVDHFACPIGVGYYRGREAERFADWRRDIRELAAAPNVYMKLGGLGMIITGCEYHLAAEPPSSAQVAADWRPWVETCIEAFGPERCLFESNFPVDKAMVSYPVLWNAYKRLAAGASPAERSSLFSGTAARLYRIPHE